MKKLIGTIILFLLVFLISAQPLVFVKQWDYRYGGINSDLLAYMQQTADGGYILGGSSTSVISDDKTQANWDTTLEHYDYWIVKTNAFGNKEWDKRFGGLLQDNFYTVKQTVDNGYIIGGNSYSNAGGDKSENCRGGFDYWVVKTDAAGNKEWDKRFGGGGDEYLWGGALQQTMDSGYILAGTSYSFSSGGDKTQANFGGSDYWVVKIDAQGNKQWDKRYGGNDGEQLLSVTQCRGGGYLIGGDSHSDSTGDKTQNNWAHGYQNYWIIKLDSAGNKIWDKRYGGTRGEYFAALQQTSDNGFILSGSSYSDISGDKTQTNHSNQLDYWIVKIDSVGNKQWDKDYGALGEERLQSLSLTQDGGYLLGGDSYSSVTSGDKSENNLGYRQPWIVKLDSLGNKQWDKTVFLNGATFIGNAIQTQDGCYMVSCATDAGIAGYKTQVARGDSSGDYWIMKFCMDTFTSIDNGQQTTDNSKIQIQAYPNPFSSDLSIALKGQDKQEVTFTITNAMGQVIYKREESNLAQGYTKVLDLSYLPSGVYFVEVSSGGENMVKRLVKE